MSTSDEELVRRVQRDGNQDALSELIQRHMGRVRGIAFQMLLDDEAADDLAQEVFLKVVRSLHSFRADARFSTWLYRIAMNTVYSAVRKQQGGIGENQPLPFDELTSNNATPERVAIGVELGSKIQAALADLSPKLRAAIVLTCIHQKSVEEVAEIEGCKPTTVYWRVHEARQQLKRRLGEDVNG